MNKYIKEQLAKAQVILPAYSDDTEILIIKKSNTELNTVGLSTGQCYAGYLEDYIINEPANFTLSINWNNGTKPLENKVNFRVLQLMGKMVKISTIGIEHGTTWEGWVPIKSIKILGEL